MGGQVSRTGNIFPDVAIKAPAAVATNGAAITLAGVQTIDGTTVGNANERVLVKDQTDATTNGIYTAQTGQWQRTVDASKNTDFLQGTVVFVTGGGFNAGRLFQQTCPDSPIVLGTSHLAFVPVPNVTSPPFLSAQIYTPEQFGAVGDGLTDDAPAINRMFEAVPSGATCYFAPKYYRVKKQAGLGYGIRLRKAIRMIGALGGAGGAAAIVYDNSFTSTDNVFLIQPPGTDNSLNLFTIYGLEIGNIYFVPFAQSLGFVLTLFSWDPTKEYSLYAKDVIHFDVRASTALGRIYVHDLYIFGTGGPGGGIGVGKSINIDCDPTSGGMYSSVFERIHMSGGMKINYIGDSNTFRDFRMDGKSGVEYLIQPGAVETVFENFNTSILGPVMIGHWGSKISWSNFNSEAHGLQAGMGPDVAMFDILNDLLPNGPTIPCNGLTFDAISTGDQTASTGGLGTGYQSLIFLNNSIGAVFRACEFYSSQPNGSPTTNAISLGSNASYTFLEGPFTRQALTGVGAIANLVTDTGVGNYGVDELLSGSNANAAIVLTAPWFNVNARMRKNTTGDVRLSGAVGIGTFATGAVLTLPVGFRPDITVPFACATNASGTAGTCTLQVSTAGVLSVAAFSGTPTQVFLNGIVFKEATHDALQALG